MLPCLKPTRHGFDLFIKVQPRASRTAIVGMLGTELKIALAAPPVDNAANDALVEFLAEILDCPRRTFSLIRGGSSTHKVIRINGFPEEKANAILSGFCKAHKT